MTGLTSVTFRQLDCDEIIKLAKENNLCGIEWGGDIHAVPSDIDKLMEIKDKTKKAGLDVLSYGSYYRLLNKDNFDEILNAANILNAPIIRIWAGSVSGIEASEQYISDAINELKLICEKDKKYNINIGLEYHRQTLTDNYKTTINLLKQVNINNLFTYWQPNPDLTLDEQLEEIINLKGYIKAVHVFSWEKGNVRKMLKDGIDQWTKYIKQIQNTDIPYILEFVVEDDVKVFCEDSKTLNKLICEYKEEL